MDADVVDLRAVGRPDVGLVGGKAAQLGELARLGGVRVPDGVCVTTSAFRRALATDGSIRDALRRLSASRWIGRHRPAARIAPAPPTLRAGPGPPPPVPGEGRSATPRRALS